MVAIRDLWLDELGPMDTHQARDEVERCDTYIRTLPWMDFELMQETWPKLLAAVPETLLLAGSSLAIGFFMAVGIALIRLSPNPILSNLAYGYVERKM